MEFNLTACEFKLENGDTTVHSIYGATKITELHLPLQLKETDGRLCFVTEILLSDGPIFGLLQLLADLTAIVFA